MSINHRHRIYAVVGCHCTDCDRRRRISAIEEPGELLSEQHQRTMNPVLHIPAPPTIEMPTFPEPLEIEELPRIPMPPAISFDFDSAKSGDVYMVGANGEAGYAGVDEAVAHNQAPPLRAREEDFGVISIDSAFPPAPPPNAATFLRRAADAMDQRAALRDSPQGERSMAKATAMFNALMVDNRAAPAVRLTELDGWRFMVCLKLARSIHGKFNADDYDDMAAYAALAGECAAAGEPS